ncbi:MAG: NifU family protein [Chloroflexi bacterium]|nr:NifU family protein [Chloroflexota bacterium]
MNEEPKPLSADDNFNAALQRLDELVQEFDELPFPDVREKAFEMLQLIDAVHRESLGRLIAFIHQQGHPELVLRAAHDPAVQTLLHLYDFLPTEDREQVELALEAIRPYIHSHGGQVQVLGVEEGIVHLRLTGTCHGCAGSVNTLQRGIEVALRDHYPRFQRIEVHDAAPVPTHQAPGVIPIDQLKTVSRREMRQPVFTRVAAVQDIPIGTYKVFEVDHTRAFIANVNGEIFAVHNNCPGSAAPLNLGRFKPPIIVCPWHNETWDIRTGKRLDGERGPNLQVLPVAIVDGTIQLAIDTAPVNGGPENA